MTQPEKLLKEMLLRLTASCTTPAEVVDRLMERNLINRRYAEREAFFHDIVILERTTGSRRMEAIRAVADRYCCSFEKVRDSFYQYLKTQ